MCFDYHGVLSARDEPRARQQAAELGGSHSKEFNLVLIEQVINCLWTAHADKQGEFKLFDAAAAALAGIKPKDGRFTQPGPWCSASSSYRGMSSSASSRRAMVVFPAPEIPATRMRRIGRT